MIMITISGMSCGHCQHAVEQALQTVDGVQSVKVNLSEGKAVVEGAADTDALLAAVREEGYEARIES